MRKKKIAAQTKGILEPKRWKDKYFEIQILHFQALFLDFFGNKNKLHVAKLSFSSISLSFSKIPWASAKFLEFFFYSKISSGW